MHVPLIRFLCFFRPCCVLNYFNFRCITLLCVCSQVNVYVGYRKWEIGNWTKLFRTRYKIGVSWEFWVPERKPRNRTKACDSFLQNMGLFCHVFSSFLQVCWRGMSLPDYSLKWLLSLVYMALWRNMVLLRAACSWDCAVSSLILLSVSGLRIWIQLAIAWGCSPPCVLSLFLHVPTTSRVANNEKIPV